MGVYFPNMKKPPTCSECPVKLDCGLYLDVPDGGIDSNCPVIYVNSSHGKLGDLDALYEVAKIRSMGIYGPCNYQCVITGDDILKAPTIVPAEGEKDDG
jgi:hypothetical protein